MNTNEYFNHLRAISKRAPKIQIRNVIKTGFPNDLKDKKIEIIDYLFERSTPRCPLSYNDFDILDYFRVSGEYHHLIGIRDNQKVILICKIG